MFGPLVEIFIASTGTHTVGSETIPNDKRIIITKLIAEFGTVEYEWQEIGFRTEIVDLTTL